VYPAVDMLSTRRREEGREEGDREYGMGGSFFTITILALYECKVFIHTLVL
jgi:hypothetical protein